MTTHDPDAVPNMTLAEPKSQHRAEPDLDHESTITSTTSPAGRSLDDESPDVEDVGRERVSHQTEQDASASLFADDELAGLRARWNTVQAGFVDDPRDCVQRADGLVSDVLGQLTQGFTDARSRLEEQWSRGEEASTEDLRVALTRYRDFFERLLAV